MSGAAALTAQLDASSDFDRTRAVRLLLRHPLITSATPRPGVLAAVRRHEAFLRAWFSEWLGYRLVVEHDFARLFKSCEPATPPRPLRARSGATLARRVAAGAAQAGQDATAGADPGASQDPHADLADHVIIAGYGQAGRGLARALAEQAVPHLIVTLSPEGAREAEQEELRVLRGNYARRYELLLAGVRRARLLVVADDDREMTQRVVSAARALNPELQIVARTRLDSGIATLRHAGAEHVVSEEREGTVRLVQTVLGELDVSEEALRGYADRLRAAAEAPAPASRGGSAMRLTDAQLGNPRCAHAASTGDVTPSASGCEECLELGDSWVHLRLCMTCGHVGCCDSSKNRHATKHFHATAHPIVRSFQPGENWAWCYEDETML